jgi:hypothetical protein
MGDHSGDERLSNEPADDQGASRTPVSTGEGQFDSAGDSVPAKGHASSRLSPRDGTRPNQESHPLSMLRKRLTGTPLRKLLSFTGAIFTGVVVTVLGGLALGLFQGGHSPRTADVTQQIFSSLGPTHLVVCSVISMLLLQSLDPAGRTLSLPTVQTLTDAFTAALSLIPALQAHIMALRVNVLRVHTLGRTR